jgi:small conductance mechanosensitive channel
LSTIAKTTESEAPTDLISGIGSEITVALDRWSAGQIDLTDLLVAAGLVVGAAIGGWLVRRLASRWTSEWDGTAATAGLVIGKLLSIAIYLLALGLVLEVLGFSLGPVVIIVLIVAVAAMMLRPLLSNLTGGLVLQLRSPIRPDDVIETNGIIGVVSEINTRTVVLVTGDGRTAQIPCRDVLEQTMVNFSTVGRRRSEMTFSVSEGTDVAALIDRLDETVASIGHVLQDPPPEAVVTGFDGSGLCVKVLFWHGPELWAERIARDRVGRAIAGLMESEPFALSDPTVVVRSSGPAPGGVGGEK